MGLSFRESLTVGSYVLWNRLKGTERFPLVLMLEPLFRCNLECAGCGKIQYPQEILRKRLSPQECFEAAEECGAPVVSIAGGEPLIHPEIDTIAAGLVKRKKFVYLCTNGIMLERKLQLFKLSPYLTFSIHLDGLEKRHDELVCRKGVFRAAVEAIKAAKQAGFRVTTNTTVFQGEDPAELHEMFDFLMDLGVDGMMISPGYAYAKAPDQEHFLRRRQTVQLFCDILKGSHGLRRWQFNHSPFYLDFLRGERSYQCTPWGNPTRNIFGWQRPCYLMSDGYAKNFKELLETTDWERYGTGRDPRCADCMVHCGYEPTSVLDSTKNLLNMLKAAKQTLFK
jgi:hopanoid biosynthesis associated radical SAM protein HpnH